MAAGTSDLRYAIRQLRKNPGFAAVAIVTLALGIGANAAMFGIVDRIFLRPFPFRDANRLYQVLETWNGTKGYGPPSWNDFLDWRSRALSFSGLAGYTYGIGNLRQSGTPERVRVVRATANLFDVLGVAPRLGRAFRDGEDSPGGACVAVLSDSLWRSRFGAEPELVGRTIDLDGAACHVIGIAPARFEFPIGVGDGLWTTLHPEGALFHDRGSHFLSTVGRLKPGVGEKVALAEIDGIMRQIAAAFPNDATNRGGRIVSLREWTSTAYRDKLRVLSAAVVVVLLIACVNLASMLLARATTRRRELAIRVALGAGRARIVRQMLVEAALLAVTGAVVGIVFASIGLKLLSSSVDQYLRTAEPIRVNARTFLFGLAAGGSTILLFGIIPALQAARAEAVSLRGDISATGSRRRLDRLRGALVAAETALSLVLLTAAVLVSRTLFALARQDSGVATARALTFKTSPSSETYRGKNVEASLYAPIRERLAALPGVTAVGMINRMPLEEWGINGSFLLTGRPVPRDPTDWEAEFRVVSPGYLGAVGARLIRGRDVNGSDSPSAPRVALVNDQFAKRYLGAGEPVGQEFQLDEKSPPFTIVGEYASLRQRGLGKEPDPEIDFPALQLDPGNELYQFGLASTVTFIVRTTAPPDSLTAAIRNAVRSVDPGQPTFGFRTLEEIRGASMGGDRFALVLIGAFAAIALVLCLAGIHGVISFFVAQRTRDIGVRIALGATRRHILGFVLRAALILVAAGATAGIVGSILAGGVLRSILFGVEPGDPVTLAASTALLVGAAAAAAFVPARRAAAVDPINVIRAE